jgi:hypothetical protein
MATRLASISCAVSFMVGLNTANRIDCQVRFSRRHTTYVSLNRKLSPSLGLDIDGVCQFSFFNFPCPGTYLTGTQTFPLIELELSMLLIVLRV